MTKYEAMICDANNLYQAYLASVKGSKWKESVQRFVIHYLWYIFDLQNDLKNRTLKNGPVDNFLLSERGHLRLISSLIVRDRIVRHVLCDEVLMPLVRNHIIYDNGASIKGRGISFQRKRFEVHLRRYYRQYGNEGWILFGDFSKFYDNILHSVAKKQFLALCENDKYIAWLLDLIFDGFRIDVSYLSDEEYERYIEQVFVKLDYYKIPRKALTGEKWMEKSVNIGDQLSQLIGIYYPHRIDTYVKYVRSQKYYGRYMDDWYIMSPSKEELKDLLSHISDIAAELGIHINEKKTRIVKISGTYKYLQIKYTMTREGRIIKRLNPKRVTSMRRKLKKLAEKAKNDDILYEDIENMYRSWMGDFYKLMSRQQRQHLIQLYEGLFDKSISIKNKKMVIVDQNSKEGD